MQIDGGCHCGHVAYEAEIDPEQVTICHCTDCQTLTGSPFRVTVLTARQDLRLTAQAPKLYVRTGENGHRRRQYFCPECGTPLFTAGEGPETEEWGIRWGSIRQRRELAPKRQIWRRSELPWIHALGRLPGRPGD
nr:GFA family protein [uncultured Roseococcus sp.]